MEVVVIEEKCINKECAHYCFIGGEKVLVKGEEIAKKYWNYLTDKQKLHFYFFDRSKREEIMNIIRKFPKKRLLP